MSFVKTYLGDCLDVLKELDSDSVDSVVTDPPYELGFMGKKWDSTGIAYNVDVWEECLRVLKPGGHLLAFGGARTQHRMVCAIEDAGFEIRDQIQWLYGSGFPKSMNIGKAIESNYGTKSDEWSGWGTCLKPAHEPICLARKPINEKTVAKNVLKWRTGGLNIDESRIPTNPAVDDMLRETTRGKRITETWENGSGFKNENNQLTGVREDGRFPANIILDEEVGAILDAQSGTSKSTGGRANNALRSNQRIYGKGVDNAEMRDPGFGDTGGASRFFYCPKASKSERGEGNNHPTVKPIKLIEYLIKLITPSGGTVLDPFMGSGTTGLASKNLNFNFIGIELDENYFRISNKRLFGNIKLIRRKKSG